MSILVDCPDCGGTGGRVVNTGFALEFDPECGLCEGAGCVTQAEADDYLGVQPDSDREAVWRAWEARR